jgi:uncharacterized protein
MTNPWLVPIAILRRNVGSQRDEHREGRLDELSVAGVTVPRDADVVLDVTLSSVVGGVEVIGTVRAPWQGECRRCLQPVSGQLASSVRELYQPADPSLGGDAGEETYELGSDYLDLAPLARDAILLDLPLAPLCRDDCAGLCPTCGADLNDGACDCPTDVIDPRWVALEALRPGPESAS